MNYKETGFRAVFHKFCVVQINKTVRNALGDDMFPGSDNANCVLTYGYIDCEAGVTLEILAAAEKTDQDLKIMDGNDQVFSKLRIGAVEEAELCFLTDEGGHLAKRFEKKLEMIKTYEASEEVEKSRQMEFLDPCRHAWFVDDVMVRLVKEGLGIEECWVRITGLGEHWFIGTLLNEPYQDYGYHEGDTIQFFVYQTEDRTFCYSDLNPPAEDN